MWWSMDPSLCFVYINSGKKTLGIESVCFICSLGPTKYSSQKRTPTSLGISKIKINEVTLLFKRIMHVFRSLAKLQQIRRKQRFSDLI